MHADCRSTPDIVFLEFRFTPTWRMAFGAEESLEVMDEPSVYVPSQLLFLG